MAKFKQLNSYTHVQSGKAPDLGSTFFRSKMERNVARYLKAIGITDYRYEPIIYKFDEAERGAKSYCPDFYLPTQDIIIECKGYFRPPDGTKVRKLRKYHPEAAAKLQVIVTNPTCETARKYQKLNVPVFAYYKDILKASSGIPYFES